MDKKKFDAAKPAPPAQRSRAARRVVDIDLTNESLRARMIKQQKYGGDNWLTIYRGSRAELLAAGVPEKAFPKQRERAARLSVRTLNVCSTHSREQLIGSIEPLTNGDFELDVEWGSVIPLEESHPAIAELARMLRLDVKYWSGDAWPPDLKHPMKMLAEDPRSEYRPPHGSPSLEVSAEFRKKLNDYASELYQFVYTHCEVIQSADAAEVLPRPSSLRLVVDNTR